MRQRRHLRLMRNIAELRQVQRLAAEARVGRANATLAEAEAEREAQGHELAARQQQWGASLADQRLEIEMSRVWANAVLTTAGDFAQAGERVAEAQSVQAHAKAQWRDAIARVDVATELAGDARRALMRRLDEVAMEEAADRAARKASAR